jgi:hypothetical protein
VYRTMMRMKRRRKMMKRRTRNRKFSDRFSYKIIFLLKTNKVSLDLTMLRCLSISSLISLFVFVFGRDFELVSV